jgi:hypothetical protein
MSIVLVLKALHKMMFSEGASPLLWKICVIVMSFCIRSSTNVIENASILLSGK